MRFVWEVIDHLASVHWSILAVVGTLAAFVVGHELGPLVLARLAWWRRTSPDRRQALQLAAGVMFAASMIRVTVPKDPEWFGQLGDYFNPPLAVVSLFILAQAIGLQRRDLRETRRALRIARRQLRDSRRSQLLLDTPWVLVEKLAFLDQNAVVAELQCVGTGPAINVVVSVRGHGTPEASTSDLSGTRAVLAAGSTAVVRFPDDRDARSRCPSPGELLHASIAWQNAHGVQLAYTTQLRPASHGGWEAAGPLVVHRPLYPEAKREPKRAKK